MIHDHNHTKSVGIREFQQNIYQNLPAPGEATLITNRGQAVFCVSSILGGGGGAGGGSALRATIKGESSNENDSQLHTG